MEVPQWERSYEGAFQGVKTLAVTATILLCMPPSSEPFQSVLLSLTSTNWNAHDTALAQRQEAELRAAGHDPVLRAEEVQRLTLLLLPHAARLLEEGPPQPPHIVAAVCRAALDASCRLMHLYPGSASLRHVHASVLSLDTALGRQTAAAYRAALQAAEASNCELLQGCGLWQYHWSWWHAALCPSCLSWLPSMPTNLTYCFLLAQPICWLRMLPTAWLCTCCIARRAPPGPWPRCAPCCSRQSAASSCAGHGCLQTASCESRPRISGRMLQRLPQPGLAPCSFQPSAPYHYTSLTENSQAPACDACGTRSPKLRRCAACKGRAYW